MLKCKSSSIDGLALTRLCTLRDSSRAFATCATSMSRQPQQLCLPEEQFGHAHSGCYQYKGSALDLPKVLEAVENCSAENPLRESMDAFRSRLQVTWGRTLCQGKASKSAYEHDGYDGPGFHLQ